MSYLNTAGVKCVLGITLHSILPDLINYILYQTLNFDLQLCKALNLLYLNPDDDWRIPHDDWNIPHNDNIDVDD